MTGFGFGALALVVAAGLAGPLLAAVPMLSIPVVVGELLAGLLLGRTGLGVLDPTDHAFAFLGNIGFALVMFVAGTHVPIRGMSGAALPIAATRALLVAVAACGLGAGLAAMFHTGHAAVYAVVMASSSAALALPVIQQIGVSGRPAQELTAQIAIADAVCIVMLPLVIDPPRATTAAAGGALIAVLAVVLYVALREVDRRGLRRRLHRYSEGHRFALELRISLLVLFTLCAVAVATQVSIMLAGFALGLVINAVGEPRRMARQLLGVSEGLFAPLFFVWLGASLQVRELAEHPAYLWLGLALGAGAVAAHCAGRILGQPIALAALSAAQLGVPVAAAALGAERRLLSPGEPAALILGALVTVAVTSGAAYFAVRHTAAEKA